jgi:hypothetical protein
VRYTAGDKAAAAAITANLLQGKLSSAGAGIAQQQAKSIPLIYSHYYSLRQYNHGTSRKKCYRTFKDQLFSILRQITPNGPV